MAEPQAVAILHGGPLDGRVMPIGEPPAGATTPAPDMFVHVEKGLIHYHRLRDDPPAGSSSQTAQRPHVPGEAPGYHYDYCHSTPR